ncbi:MAG: F0F1 ATP synthase subunit alpha [Candidatus Omnitrophota bacterium]
MQEINIRPLEIKDVGTVKEIKGGVIKIGGLASCVNGQLIELAPDLMGMVIGFTKKEVLVLVLGDENKVHIGDTVYGEEGVFSIPVGNNFIGRIVNTFGQPLDGKGKIEGIDSYPIFRNAPGVLDRALILEPFLTGTKIIDTCIPLGKGQRELILGDRVTGKTSLVIDAIINQKDKDVICIYCWVGGSQSAFLKIVEQLKQSGAMDWTIIVSASASSSPAEQYLVPYAACALGEYFMDHGRDVFCGFDNLSRHAWIYRELSLLLERSPGREAYPGDAFYIHSQLMERAGKLSEEKGSGSMTFLPIVETQEGDITGLIQSNLVSITDGQIYLNAALFNEGFRPAIDLGLSVSRIGSKVQCDAIKKVSLSLKREFAQYKELAGLTTIKTKLSADIELRLKRGQTLKYFFIQDKSKPLSVEEMVVLFYAFNKEVPQILEESQREKFKLGIYDFLLKNYPDLVEELAVQKLLTGGIERGLDKAFEEFFAGSDNV